MPIQLLRALALVRPEGLAVNPDTLQQRFQGQACRVQMGASPRSRLREDQTSSHRGLQAVAGPGPADGGAAQSTLGSLRASHMRVGASTAPPQAGPSGCLQGAHLPGLASRGRSPAGTQEPGNRGTQGVCIFIA